MKELKKAILDMDENVIDAEGARGLATFAPTPDEVCSSFFLLLLPTPPPYPPTSFFSFFLYFSSIIFLILLYRSRSFKLLRETQACSVKQRSSTKR